MAGTYHPHVALALLASVSFWAQSVVTEERLVPALNIISDHHGIPDDVAGATLMAAGASSPELLCTLVSLFITRSSLGLGTIVGSEVFNQLVICAGSVYATKAKTLVLDGRMVARETAFYGLSLGLLYVALSESRDDGGEKEHVYVSFWKACLLFGGYVLYVVVCANTELVEGWIRRLSGQSEIDEGSVKGDEDETNAGKGCQSEYHLQEEALGSREKCASPGSVHYKSFDDPDLHELPFIYNVTTEPVENLVTAGTTQQPISSDDDGIVITNSSLSRDQGEFGGTGVDDGMNEHTPRRRNVISRALHKSFKLLKANHLLCRSDHPVEIHDVYEMTSNDGAHEIGCFLWQRSIFYTKAYFGSHGFHLRWFTIAPGRVSSVPDRQEPERHELVYPLFDEIHVDERRLIIYIVHPEEGRRDFTLMAPSKAIFDAVVRGLEEYMGATRPLRQQGMTELDDSQHPMEDAATMSTQKTRRDADADPHVELIELPPNASKLELALWVSVYPLRLIMHLTLPDVRHLDRHGQPEKSVAFAYLSTVSCLAWLIVGSYVMVASLESLAALLGLPDAIMGVTVSAAGTSLPAYIASRIAAEKGFGNQAVANVFGSNTFNICIGLGLPWVIFIAVNGLEPYHDLESDGILESILVMTGVLLIFVALMISSGFVLVKWHADLFICLYVIYITYCIGQVYW